MASGHPSCTICCNEYGTHTDINPPLVLPCGHSFCAICCKKATTYGDLCCFTCRKPCRFKNIPKNYALIDCFSDPSYGRCVPSLQVNTCTKCQGSFPSRDLLDKHFEETGHGIKCFLCSKILCNESEYEKHKRDTHHECKICERLFKSALGYQQHYQAKHDFPCRYCTKNLDSDSERTSHEYHSHYIPCSHCDRRFSTQNGADDHFGRVHGFPCPVYDCDYDFCSRKERSRHLVYDHDWSKCVECTETFRSRIDCDRHEVDAHGRFFECCGRLFRDSNALAQHKAAKHYYDSSSSDFSDYW